MDRKELSRLLSSRNEPSVLEKEALFAQAFHAMAPPRAHNRRWGILLSAFASLAAVATVVALLYPRTRPQQYAMGEFESRGTASSQPAVRLTCVDHDKEVPCALGQTLTFEIAGIPPRMTHVAAFSRGADGVVLWYFPSVSGRSDPIDPTRSVLSQAVRLGPPHTAGDYEIFLVFTPAARTRAEIKDALGPRLEPKDEMLVIKQSLRLGAPQ